jgi:trehalose-phosphatase
MLDIDGTLCEIVERPDDAMVPRSARWVLQRLAGRRDSDVHIAFVTGRSVADAQRMLGIAGAPIYGNHGMEYLSAAGNIRVPVVSETGPAEMRAAARDLADVVAAFPGTSLEDKYLSLSLHFRGMNMEQLPYLNARVAEIARQRSLKLSPGKGVINVLPSLSANKGDAVLEIVSDAAGGVAGASILFAGDDVTDEDGFRALQEVPGAITVCVGDAAEYSLAEFSLDGPDQVHELLDLLAVSRL